MATGKVWKTARVDKRTSLLRRQLRLMLGFSYQTSWTPHFRKAITMMATKSSALLQWAAPVLQTAIYAENLFVCPRHFCVGERRAHYPKDPRFLFKQQKDSTSIRIFPGLAVLRQWRVGDRTIDIECRVEEESQGSGPVFVCEAFLSDSVSIRAKATSIRKAASTLLTRLVPTRGIL